MRNKVKDIDIKNYICYFFDDTIFGHHIGYVTIKDSKYIKINSVNSLYLIFNKVNGYFKEINGNKFLTLVSTNENKENIKKI